MRAQQSLHDVTELGFMGTRRFVWAAEIAPPAGGPSQLPATLPVATLLGRSVR